MIWPRSLSQLAVYIALGTMILGPPGGAYSENAFDSAIHAEFVFNTWSDPDKVILWNEDETLSVGWYISGTVCFAGSDPPSGEYWDGACYPRDPSKYPDPDWSRIQYQVVVEWNAFDDQGNKTAESGDKYREIIFGPKTFAEVQNKRKIGNSPGEFSPAENIWWFHIPLDGLELNFPVPNQCDAWPGDGGLDFVNRSSLPAHAQDRLFRIYCTIQYPHWRWVGDPPRERDEDIQTIRSEIRYAMIKDQETGCFDDEPLQPFIRQNLTTHDPLPVRTITCVVCDNNPNQEVETVILNFGGDEREMREVSGSAKRHYEKPSAYDGKETERYSSTWVFNLDDPPPEGFGPGLPLAPNWRDPAMQTGPPFNVEPLIVGIEATLKWGDANTVGNEWVLDVSDNDAPGVHLSLRPLGEQGRTITISEGTMDLPNQRSRVLVEIQQPPNPIPPVELDDPWPDFNDYIYLDGSLPDIPDPVTLTEGKRTWITVEPRDNIDQQEIAEIGFGPPGSTSELPFNPSTGAFEQVVIFRNPAPAPQMYELILKDHSGNIRKVRFPVLVIDTRLDVYELESSTGTGRK